MEIFSTKEKTKACKKPLLSPVLYWLVYLLNKDVVNKNFELQMILRSIICILSLNPKKCKLLRKFVV